MEKFIIKIFLLTATIQILISCNDKCVTLQKDVKEIMGKDYLQKITLPKDVEIINVRDSTGQKQTKRYTLIHFFTADCDACIDELKNIQNVLSKFNTEKFANVLFIASAPTKYYLEEAINEIKFQHPVMYEKQYLSFKIMNDLSFDDNVYNTMILNENNEVLLFGSYFSNKKAQRMFDDIIECGL